MFARLIDLGLRQEDVTESVVRFLDVRVDLQLGSILLRRLLKRFSSLQRDAVLLMLRAFRLADSARPRRRSTSGDSAMRSVRSNRA